LGVLLGGIIFFIFNPILWILGAENVNEKTHIFLNKLIFNITNMYDHIKTKENYDKLLKSGMFWEFHPELSGNWEIDKKLINK
jgi:hypothetical protein